MSKDRLTIEHDSTIRLDVSLVNLLIRNAYRSAVCSDRDAHALKVGRECVSGLTDEQILAIARSEAELVGITPGPITYQDVK